MATLVNELNEDTRRMHRILRTVSLYRKPDASHEPDLEIVNVVDHLISDTLIPDDHARIDCGLVTAGIYPERALQGREEFDRITCGSFRPFLSETTSLGCLRSVLLNDHHAYRMMALGAYYGHWVIDTCNLANPVARRQIAICTR